MATRKERQPQDEAAPKPTRPRAVLTKRTRGRSAPEVPTIAVSPEHIRVRAYYLSLERNGSAADSLADWLAAERELTAAANER